MFIRSSTFALLASILFAASSPERLELGGKPALQRFETLWLIIYADSLGNENIANARTAAGELVPLMAADEDRLQSIIEAGKALAASQRIKLRLIKFTQRSEIGEFTPSDVP